jgi:hypothetical protein
MNSDNKTWKDSEFTLRFSRSDQFFFGASAAWDFLRREQETAAKRDQSSISPE